MNVYRVCAFLSDSCSGIIAPRLCNSEFALDGIRADRELGVVHFVLHRPKHTHSRREYVANPPAETRKRLHFAVARLLLRKVHWIHLNPLAATIHVPMLGTTHPPNLFGNCNMCRGDSTMCCETYTEHVTVYVPAFYVSMCSYFVCVRSLRSNYALRRVTREFVRMPIKVLHTNTHTHACSYNVYYICSELRTRAKPAARPSKHQDIIFTRSDRRGAMLKKEHGVE